MASTNAALAASAVCQLLCCCVFFVDGASAFYSVPADPRHPTPIPTPSSPGPAASQRERGYYNHGFPAPSPRRNHHHNRSVSPAPASPHYYSAPAPATPPYSAPGPSAGSDDVPSLLPPPVYSRAPQPPQQATTTPHFGFPLEPTVGVAAARPAGAPASGEGYPFIGSNPTVPLPTGVTDTATVLPQPDTARGHADVDGKVVGRAAAEPVPARAAMIGLMLVLLSTVLLLLPSCS